MRNNCRLEVHLLFAFRFLATATHSSRNSRHVSHRRPHDVVAAHCPRQSHPPADELAPAMLDVAPLFPARGQVPLQPWSKNKFYFIYTPRFRITYHLLLCHQVVVEQYPEISGKIGDFLLLCHQGATEQPPDFCNIWRSVIVRHSSLCPRMTFQVQC